MTFKKLPLTIITDPTYLYGLVVVVGVIASFLFPKTLSQLSHLTTLFLAIIFFLSALKVSPRELLEIVKDPKTIIAFNLIKFIIIPLIIYAVASVTVPFIMLPLLLLAMMPPGMSSPVLAEIVGGRQSLALVVAVTSSLLAPALVPFFLKLIAGISVNVDLFPIMLSITEVVIVPFALAWIVRWIKPSIATKINPISSYVSVILLGLLMTGILSVQVKDVYTINWANVAIMLLSASLAVLFFYAVGLIAFFKKQIVDRITLTVGLANINFTLALFLIHQYFNTPENVLTVVCFSIPWFTCIIFFKIYLRHAHHQKELEVINSKSNA